MERLMVRGPQVRAAQVLGMFAVGLALFALRWVTDGDTTWAAPVALGLCGGALALAIIALLVWRFTRATYVIDAEGVGGEPNRRLSWSRVDSVWESKLLTVPALIVVRRPVDGRHLVSTPARRFVVRFGILPRGALVLPVARSASHSYEDVVAAVRQASDGVWPLRQPTGDPPR